MKSCVMVAVVGLGSASAIAADPWAAHVVSYVEGAGVGAGFNNPASALGEPTRFTGVGVFPGAVTPFNPAYMAGEIVSIGAGGSLTLRFDAPVADDPANPFGIDLLIFGNAGYIDTNFPTGTAGPLFSAGGGLVEVSADGLAWQPVVGAVADGAFPTLGYSDLTDPFALNPGTILSDFTKPVDPAFNPTGLAFGAIVAGYSGSGGGSGIDLSTTGLASILYVRISNTGTGTVEIDAVSDVIPSPSSVALLGIAGLFAARRRSR
jgi:hypothetical protein